MVMAVMLSIRKPGRELSRSAEQTKDSDLSISILLRIPRCPWDLPPSSILYARRRQLRCFTVTLSGTRKRLPAVKEAYFESSL